MNRVDRRVKAADPLRLDPATLPEEAAQALLKEIVMQPNDPPPVQPRRRSRVTVVALAVALLVGVPGAALGVYQGVHSGFFGTGGESEPGEEFLYADSPEIVAVVKDLTAEFALPGGAGYGPLLARYPAKERVLMQRTTLGQEVSFYAACAWYRYWLEGDAAQRAVAQSTVDAIPSWKYWRSEGPNPQQRIVEETRAGEDRTLRQFVTANC